MEPIRYTFMESPVGRLLLGSDGERVRFISFSGKDRERTPEPEWREDRKPFAEATRQLRAYFAGERHDFDFAYRPSGTPFQLRVWRELVKIPYGETTSYGELARRIGNPNASRAVGLANGSNPIPIVIPCHRVIGSNGKLTGYGGGLDIKEKLLELEGVQLAML